MPRSHIHGSPRRFHYGSNLTHDPGNAIFRSPTRMHNGVATGFDVSTKDKIEKEPFGSMNDTVCYALVPNATFKYENDTVKYGTTRVKACALRVKNGLLRPPTVQVRVSTDKKGLRWINTNRHGPNPITSPSYKTALRA